MDTKLNKKIKFSEDEIIKYEKDKIIVFANTKPRSTKYFGSMITITNYRIILSQKMLFGGYQIHYIIHMKGDGSNFSIKGGYISCISSKENIKYINDKKSYIQIVTSGGALVGILDVYVNKPKEVLKIIEQNYKIMFLILGNLGFICTKPVFLGRVLSALFLMDKTRRQVEIRVVICTDLE